MQKEEYCGICLNLRAPVTRHGFKPECTKKKKTFKEVVKLNYHAGELKANVCNLFIHYQKKSK